MDFKNLKIPFIEGDKIKKEADSFRIKHFGEKVPVGIVKIVELKLRIDVIPVPELQDIFGIDALITSDFKSIYIDSKRYLDDRYENNRLKFSLAHEIAHFVLHKKLYNSFDVESIDDFYRLLKELPQKEYGKLEVQASIFANHLLVPREKLDIFKDRLIKKLNKEIREGEENIKDIDNSIINQYLVMPVSRHFKVSEDTARIALERS